MTKVSIFGQADAEAKKLKPIEFVKTLLENGELEDAESEPKNWGNLILLEKKYTSSKMDLILAYDENPNCGSLYLGHWNDGVV